MNTTLRLFRASVFTLMLTLTHWAAADPDEIEGTYDGEVAKGGATRVVEVILKPAGDKLKMTGSAAWDSGKGAAPEFKGSDISKDDDEYYTFTFEDSFGNKGTAQIQETKGGIIFSAKITKVQDARCLALYEKIKLKKKGK